MRRVWDAGFCADFGCGVCLPLKAANAARKLQKPAAEFRGGLSICHLLFRQYAADLASEVERAPGADGVVLTCKR